ncbi:MAG: hypothetical protein ACYS0G_15690 [Planctomycetota bacterium]|jgi:hypothetical protein
MTQTTLSVEPIDLGRDERHVAGALIFESALKRTLLKAEFFILTLGVNDVWSKSTLRVAAEEMVRRYPRTCSARFRMPRDPSPGPPTSRSR